MDERDLSAIRREYLDLPLTRATLAASPLQQFEIWFEQHRQLDPDNATAMVLATASAEGYPSARVVLLKQFDKHGFSWFTDYRSHKGQQLAQNPRAELLFYWPLLDRQVRINGSVERLEPRSAREYFAQRPRGSQLSAAVSCQSHRIDNRAELEAAAEKLQAQLGDAPVPCPKDWGGYRLVPERFEFWQGRPSRLHDRLYYQRQGETWEVGRLAP